MRRLKGSLAVKKVRVRENDFSAEKKHVGGKNCKVRGPLPVTVANEGLVRDSLLNM